MPSFREFLEARHPAGSSDRLSEMYSILLQTGVYTEASLLQEVQALVDRNTDPSMMNESDTRKFLTFFYVPVRNVIPASGKITVDILSSTAPVSVGPDQYLTAVGGLPFRTLGSSGVADAGESLEINVSQSESGENSGTYNQFIVFDADNVVMESIQVYLGSSEVPRVNAPSNGYMAFFFNRKIYIKIFPGVDIRVIQGQPYSVGYTYSQGAAGNLKEGAFSSFNFPLQDTNGNPVKYSIRNDPFTNGANAPSLAELRDLLRRWLYVRNVLTKPSDYKLWFLTQPEVGDCLVWGDTENALMTGVVTITGLTNVCLLGSDAQVVPAPVKADLMSRIQPFKDVGYLAFSADPSFIYHYYEVKYLGSEDDGRFATDVAAAITWTYDLSKQREANRSLFDSVDVGGLLRTLTGSRSRPKGLEIIPYYYKQATLAAGATLYTTTLPSPNNLKKGYTKYRFSTIVGGVVTDTEDYYELMTSGSVATIYDSTDTSRGTHNYQTNTLTINPATTFPDGKMEVFAEALNRSYLDTGAFTRVRKLGGFEINKIQESF
jgi:hypothetical protein